MDNNLPVEQIEDIDFSTALGERYLAYALSTIMSRSLPDVRDGLKPVHRRLLYAMSQLNLSPKSAFKKCARVVGDVIGKYHPHGDVAVYDTLVRLAQQFSVRYPLIDGQGNFGSIDGDNAAAMRYTESRLTEVALALLNDLNLNTVDFKPTYDDQENEPVLLPSSFPNLLANGSEGIAVGMATSIPPHNLHELCDGLIKLIEKPDVSISELVKIIPGPDFPTGGVIINEAENTIIAYSTGRGSFRLRASWVKEELNHGLYQVVITEIPYQIQKSKLIEKIADLYKEKKLALLGNIHDESADDVRIILEPKNRNVDAEMMMESLFKLTDLEVRINLNLNVLDKNSVPQVMNLKQVLEAFIEHRLIIVTRRTKFRLAQIESKLELLAGLIIAYLNLDEIIQIIRDEDEPKPIFIKKFKLTENQAEAILNMKLRSLRKIDEIAIKKEHDQLIKNKAELEQIIASSGNTKKTIIKEIKEVQVKFGYGTAIGDRRTIFADATALEENISIEAFIEKEPVSIICSEMNWIRAIKHHHEDFSDIKYKEGDSERFTINASTTDKLIIFTSKGKFYTITVDKLAKGKGHGDPIKLLIDLDDDDHVIDIMVFDSEQKYVIATKSGKGFIVAATDLLAQTKSGKQVLNLNDSDQALLCRQINGDSVAVIGSNRKLLICKIEEIPLMKRGQGVSLQKYKLANLSDVKTFNYAEGLNWQLGGRTRIEKDLLPWLNKRGGVGRLPPIGFPKNNRFGE